MCSLTSQGNPPGSFQCSCVLNNGTLCVGETGANVLSYYHENKVETKSFTCRPVSSLMDNLPGITISPVISRDPQIVSFTANGNESSLVVDVGDLLTLACITSGLPVPTVEFGIYKYVHNKYETVHYPQNRSISTLGALWI